MVKTNEYIRFRRNQIGKTLDDVAKDVGVSEGTVSRWESGEISNMRRDKIHLLAKSLCISPIQLLDLDDVDLQELAELSSVFTLNESTALSDNELTKSIYELLGQLTPIELEKVAAFVQGLLASH